MGTIYTNSDGLQIRFGTDEAQVARSGSVSPAGAYKTFTYDLQWGATGSSGGYMPLLAENSLSLNRTNAVALPAGWLLKSATLITEVAFTSAGSPVLDIGLSKEDGTVIDEDGIDVAIAMTAIDAIGETVACDGALVGTVLAFNSYLTVEVDTADYTAGRAKLIIELMAIGA